MRGYKVRAVGGRLMFVRTQEEARKHGPAELVEIPTDHKGLVDFLNQVVEWERDDNAARLPRGPVPDSVTPHPAEPEPPLYVQQSGRGERVVASTNCPKCKLTPEAAQKHAWGIEADALVERILDGPAWFAGRLFEALGERWHQSVKGGRR